MFKMKESNSSYASIMNKICLRSEEIFIIRDSLTHFVRFIRNKTMWDGMTLRVANRISDHLPVVDRYTIIQIHHCDGMCLGYIDCYGKIQMKMIFDKDFETMRIEFDNDFDTIENINVNDSSFHTIRNRAMNMYDDNELSKTSLDNLIRIIDFLRICNNFHSIII